MKLGDYEDRKERYKMKYTILLEILAFVISVTLIHFLFLNTYRCVSTVGKLVIMSVSANCHRLKGLGSVSNVEVLITPQRNAEQELRKV